MRTLEPTLTGLPIKVCIFTRATHWESYEAIQLEIFDHLLAAADHFNLRVFQEPTGMDFAAYARIGLRRGLRDVLSAFHCSLLPG